MCIEVANVEKMSAQKPVGMKNSNLKLCFANAALQMLYACEEIRRFLSSQNMTEDMKTASALKKLFNEMSGHEIVDVKNLFATIGWEMRHHDATEFMEVLFERIERELPSWREKFYATFTTTTFSMETQLLKFPVQLNDNLEKALMEHTGQGLMLPPLILIQVYRVSDSGKERSIQAFKFPSELDVGKILMETSKHYTLKAVIAQNGSALSGHYIAFIRNGLSWFKCDDDKIHESSIEMVMETSEGRYSYDFCCSNLLYEEM
jgi:ubiquitin C-terminal hydrolase